MFAKSDYLYNLPVARIAQYPCGERSNSRLLLPQAQNTVDASDINMIDEHFFNLPHWLKSGDLLVFNDTKVSPVRLLGKKSSGGNAEVFIEVLESDFQGLAHCKLSHAKAGNIINVMHPKSSKTAPIVLLEKINERWRIDCEAANISLADLIEEYGHTPLPPYLSRVDEESDREHYQTIFANKKGAVAAPTAGLHFDALLMKKLADKAISHTFITLQVGAGTFVPLRHNDIRQHTMHREAFEVSEAAVLAINQCKVRGGRVIAVGTTSLRALETAAIKSLAIKSTDPLTAFSGSSNLFVTPGFNFKVVDGLITNFHQSASTLMILVSAFAGHRLIKEAYQYALAGNYRFLSYGDGMFIWRAQGELRAN